ncbi:MAG: acetolactate synthase small subunit [Planctomycetes bacterium]|nr:acetolactate synthase small subunit [Planctomycetota bacterium]
MNRLTTIAILTENRPGVMARVSQLFSRRGFNLLSVNAEETDRRDLYCITVVVDEDEATLEQISRQVMKLIDVEEVVVLSPRPTVERQVALVKVRAEGSDRVRISDEATVFGARIAHKGARSLTLEIADDAAQIDAFLEAMRPFGLIEVVKSGKVSLLRSDDPMFRFGHPSDGGAA